MANTNLLKILVEPYVRSWLTKKYDIEFENDEKEMHLMTGGIHRFDVVSKDGNVVAGIKTSALRENGKVGTGVIKSTFAELYYLSLMKAKIKLMILTDKGYCDYFRKKSKGKLAKNIKIVHCPLPNNIEKNIAAIHKKCRIEIGKK